MAKLIDWLVVLTMVGCTAIAGAAGYWVAMALYLTVTTIVMGFACSEDRDGRA